MDERYEKAMQESKPKLKQTAVDWLVNQLEEQIRKSAHNELGTTRTGDYRIGLRKAIDFCEQTKQMEKEQMIDAYVTGRMKDKNIKYGIEYYNKLEDFINEGEEYYNKTYNNETI